MACDSICEVRPRHSSRFDRWFAVALWNVARIVEAALLELALRREMRRLSSYDERLLKDIGLSHAEIEAAVRSGRQSRAGG